MFRSQLVRAAASAARHTQPTHFSSTVTPAIWSATNEILYHHYSAQPAEVSLAMAENKCNVDAKLEQLVRVNSASEDFQLRIRLSAENEQKSDSCSSMKFSKNGLNSMDFDNRKSSVSPSFFHLRDKFSQTNCSSHSTAGDLRCSSKFFYSTLSFGSDDDDGEKKENEDIHNDDFVPVKRESMAQSVDPRRGWNFRGVHKAIICGKIGQAPVQKLLRNGRTLTIFTVGTGGMYDQRTLGARDLPRPAQWHRIVVHNEALGEYAVRQLVKSSSVYVEGDIEIRVYNRGISGEVVKLPEICVRHDGKIRLIKPGESASTINFEELREGLR